MIADFNKKQKTGFSADKIAFQMAGILFLVIILVLAFADFKIYKKKQELTSQINNYQKQIQSIKQNNQTLKNEIANSDNIDYLEKIAYEQLGQQKPGEKEIIFVSPQDKTIPSSQSQNFWDNKSWFGWLSESWSWIKSKF